jgi:hypothetical protein
MSTKDDEKSLKLVSSPFSRSPVQLIQTIFTWALTGKLRQPSKKQQRGRRRKGQRIQFATFSASPSFFFSKLKMNLKTNDQQERDGRGRCRRRQPGLESENLPECFRHVQREEKLKHLLLFYRHLITAVCTQMRFKYRVTRSRARGSSWNRSSQNARGRH